MTPPVHSERVLPAAAHRTWRFAWVAGVAIAASACGGAAAVSSGQALSGRPSTPRLGASVASVKMLRDSVRALLDQARTDSAFPGAIAVIGNRDSVLAEYGVGSLDWAPSPRPDENTLWDMASLTKVVGLTTALMQLSEAGKVDLDAPVQRYVEEFQGPNKERVTLRHLLTHSSGLPAWRPLYKETENPAAARALAVATALDTLPGIRMVYSDLGAIILGVIVERVSGEPLDAYLARHVFGPLRMTSTMYRPGRDLLPRIAPTEYDPWRQRHIRGEVHDENAYALGGVSGHAGLFSTGHDVARFCRMYLNGGALDGARIVSGETIRRFTAVQDSTFSNRALGWETPNGMNSAGRLLTRPAFGHTGFTGTSIWVDPSRDLFVILLTNRVDPTRQNLRIGAVRSALADVVVRVLDRAPAPSPSPSSPR
ncbi:MAG TPA: serine hydrolase domain-containing protein [Gemmatimonadaceae bacterium]|nr:serine hydrolase domain-containing protein [Gemmatimonadaceae bacterium]